MLVSLKKYLVMKSIAKENLELAERLKEQLKEFNEKQTILFAEIRRICEMNEYQNKKFKARKVKELIEDYEATINSYIK